MAEIGFHSFAHAETYQVERAASLYAQGTPRDFLFFSDNNGIARIYCSGWTSRFLTLNASLGSSTIERPENRLFYKGFASSTECNAELTKIAAVAYQTPTKVKVELKYRDSTFNVILQE